MKLTPIESVCQKCMEREAKDTQYFYEWDLCNSHFLQIWDALCDIYGQPICINKNAILLAIACVRYDWYAEEPKEELKEQFSQVRLDTTVPEFCPYSLELLTQSPQP